MAGKLSGSLQETLFKEYMTLVGKSEKQQSVIEAIDALCLEIAPPDFIQATKENALDVLHKFAIESHSENEFLTNLFNKPKIKRFFNTPLADKENLKEACAIYFRFVDTRTTEESFASYMVGRHRLGYEYLARYWAAILFEQIIVRKAKLQDSTYFEEMKKKPDRNGREPDLDECINFLNEEELKRDSIYIHNDIFKRYHTDKPKEYNDISRKNVDDTRKRLINFKQLRNDIMHDLKRPERMPGNNLEFIYYVWSELLPEIFTTCKDKWHKEPKYSSIIDTISELEADYWIRYVEETAKANVEISEFKPIIESDFENLFLMRKKMLLLRGIFNNWELLKDNGLTTDVVSTIDTTSAYIWMPLVPHTLKVAKKQGVYNCAVSILVTPLDFRVYMDFGGYAKDERERYYQFIESKEYQDYVNELKGNEKDEMEWFDIDWYCFISDRSKINSQYAISHEKIASAKQKLKSVIEPITWNRMLHGYIINKNKLPEVGINTKWIGDRLEWIIKFYNEFKAFERTLLEKRKDAPQ